jgi:hypothetical protein
MSNNDYQLTEIKRVYTLEEAVKKQNDAMATSAPPINWVWSDTKVKVSIGGNQR